jgi:ubiquinone/menaquinone biosynthesis C-methylase UbiE|uniref:class I SAM-dependent methyltransferase n=1 Tax=Daejeonella sp. TaxID=2805397 RepID=UPI00404B0684
MHTLKPYILLFAFLSLSMFSLGQDRYIIKTGDPNGIKKWYMGRQIAQVMSHYGIDWLEREEREREENTTLLLKNLAVKPGMVIADIGAGSGYHSALLSKIVGTGKVFAVDVEPEMIAYLNKRIKQEKLSGIIPVLSTEQKVSLPENTIDMMLLVDVYHEFSYPYEMALSMRAALKRGGKLMLVEFRSEDSTVPIKTIHKMSEAQAIKEFKAAGFAFDKNIDNLPWQHCLVFTKQ